MQRGWRNRDGGSAVVARACASNGRESMPRLARSDQPVTQKRIQHTLHDAPRPRPSCAAPSQAAARQRPAARGATTRPPRPVGPCQTRRPVAWACPTRCRLRIARVRARVRARAGENRAGRAIKSGAAARARERADMHGHHESPTTCAAVGDEATNASEIDRRGERDRRTNRTCVVVVEVHWSVAVRRDLDPSIWE